MLAICGKPGLVSAGPPRTTGQATTNDLDLVTKGEQVYETRDVNRGCHRGEEEAVGAQLMVGGELSREDITVTANYYHSSSLLFQNNAYF